PSALPTLSLHDALPISGHLLKADDVARSIGWPPRSPFQWEVGVADLGWGVLGILCPTYGSDFWLATIIVSSIFLLGAAAGHVKQDRKSTRLNSSHLVIS